MWRWLLEKLPKRTTIFGSLWLISGSVHGLILLIALLMGHIDSRQTLVVTTGARRSTDARIVLLPTLKTVRGTQFDQPVRGTQFGVAATNKPSKSQQKKSSLTKVVQADKKKEPAIKKSIKPIDKKLGSTTLAATQKDRQSLKQTKKAVEKVAKKPETKPQLKPSEEKQPVVAQAPQIKEEIKSVVEETIEDVVGDPNATQDVIYVGRDDLRAMQVQHVVADALQKNWRPPSGIAKETYCQISFDIDKEGKACNIVMQQHSKVLIFDVAARTALLQAHFNPAAEGQKFTVAFKP